MKMVLEFNLPEEHSDAERALNLSGVYAALFDIGQEVFRPARKHGYPDPEIAAVLEAADKTTVQLQKDEHELGAGTALVRLLEQKFYEILENFDVKID